MLTLTGPQDSVLLIDAATGSSVTVGQVRDRSGAVRDELGDGELALLRCDGSLESYLMLLALLAARLPVALVDPAMDAAWLARLAGNYAPCVLIDPAQPPAQWRRWAADGAPGLHPDLALLLTTSGSTGSAKLVRLSHTNLWTNAEQIVASLGLSASDRGITALPLHYSYGLSVVTSHALVGAPVVVTSASILAQDFWAAMREHRVSSLPGVPPTFAMMRRLGMPPADLPALRRVTQAGGRLAPDQVEYFHGLLRARGIDLYVMYGQTEAAPRISCLPPERLPEKLGSAGVALAGGRLVAMEDEVELAPGEVGEIVYSGPNVMMGYAECRADLALGDVQGDTLHTGDLGYVDPEGFLFLTGRSKRIAKLAGSRVSLDEVEALLPELAPVAAVDAGEAGMAVYTTIADEPVLTRARRELAHRLHLPAKLITVTTVAALPLLSSGKVDYRTLTGWAQEGQQ